MAVVQCPVCKKQLEIDIDISMKTKGLVVFRGRVVFLGNLDDIRSLLDFVRDTFRERPRLRKRVLIDRLVQVCGIPYSDACHFIRQLQHEGFMYESEKDELVFVGKSLTL